MGDKVIDFPIQAVNIIQFHAEMEKWPDLVHMEDGV